LDISVSRLALLKVTLTVTSPLLTANSHDWEDPAAMLLALQRKFCCVRLDEASSKHFWALSRPFPSVRMSTTGSRISIGPDKWRAQMVILSRETPRSIARRKFGTLGSSGCPTHGVVQSSEVRDTQKTGG